MNDGKDGAQKQEMDLVMIRAEAAKFVLCLEFRPFFSNPSVLQRSDSRHRVGALARPFVPLAPFEPHWRDLHLLQGVLYVLFY